MKNASIIKVAVQFGTLIPCRHTDGVCVYRHFSLCSLPAYPSKPTNLIHSKRSRTRKEYKQVFHTSSRNILVTVNPQDKILH